MIDTKIVTFNISNFDFMYIWSIYTKKGGKFNEFLIDYYLKEIQQKYPNFERILPKIYLLGENPIQFCEFLARLNVKHYPSGTSTIYNPDKYRRFRQDFFVNKGEIINPLDVGI